MKSKDLCVLLMFFVYSYHVTDITYKTDKDTDTYRYTYSRLSGGKLGRGGEGKLGGS
jgi:hypothetical protein